MWRCGCWRTWTGVEADEHLPRELWRVPEGLHDAASYGSELIDLLPLVVLLARVPEAMALHERLDVPRRVSLDTLDDLLRWARKFRAVHGRWGMAEMHWLIHAVAGRIYRLGRLQFEWVTCRWPALPFEAGDWLLSVHIPEMGPMDPEACDASFAAAATFVPRHFPQRQAAGYVCESWLLDPQLGEYLPANSNIVMFQQRFTLVPEASYPRDGLTQRVLPRSGDDAPSTSRSTTRLQRAVARHAARGGTWQSGVGYQRIAAAATRPLVPQ